MFGVHVPWASTAGRSRSISHTWATCRVNQRCEGVRVTTIWEHSENLKLNGGGVLKGYEQQVTSEDVLRRMSLLTRRWGDFPRRPPPVTVEPEGRHSPQPRPDPLKEQPFGISEKRGQFWAALRRWRRELQSNLSHYHDWCLSSSQPLIITPWLKTLIFHSHGVLY